MLIREKALCSWKYLLSFRTSNWTINNYPLRFAKKDAQPAPQETEWSVQVIRWWGMLASGRTKMEALSALGNAFENYKKENRSLPRPGTIGPIEFATTDQIQQLEDIAVEFFPAILGYDFHGCFVSDESSVFDFGLDEQEAVEAINARYGVTLTTLEDGNIVRILSLIKGRKCEPSGLRNLRFFLEFSLYL